MADSTARRWAPTALVAVCVALVVFFAFTALGIGGRARGAGGASPARTPFASLSLRAPHVLSTYSTYSLSSAPSPSKYPPVFASYFEGPIALYRAYAVAQLGQMQGQIARLEGALAANNRAAAKAAWRAAYASYLHLGAVYLTGQLATLNQEINGNAGGLEGGVSNPRFAGLHRIEYGLWTQAPPRALLGWALHLDVAVQTLRALLAHVSITPLEYATRAHEILEDAQRDLLSGADVPWSGEGVLATEAGLEATEEVISTLRPILGGEESIVPAVGTELLALHSVIASIAAAHGGSLPTNGQLTQRQSELLDGNLGGALEALAEVPGVLETEAPPQIPQIPQRDFKIDP
jgi:iron uptake system EfeUOB component EfeO/EfeM